MEFVSDVQEALLPSMMQATASRRRREQIAYDPKAVTPFDGFPSLTANFVYCPNQFFDVCLPNASRGTVRLVAYLLKRTLGWLDANGHPIEQEIQVSFREIIGEAGLGRGAVRASIDEAIHRRFICCTQPGRANSNDQAGQSSCFTLRWGARGQYTKDIETFDGFFVGEGHRTPIPNAFFDRVVRNEPLAVTKVVGTVLRHTVGYQNQFGGRRSQAPLSYTYIQNYARIRDRSTLSQALQQAIKTGYICRVGQGHFDPSQKARKAATYAVHWLQEAIISTSGSEIRPARQGRFKNPTDPLATVQEPDQPRYRNPTGDGSRTRPATRSTNPTTEKTTSKTLFKQQQPEQDLVAAVGNLEGYELLRTTGFDHTLATALSRSATAEEIEQQVSWLARRNPQRNPLGMLRRAIEERWAEPTNVALESRRRSAGNEDGLWHVVSDRERAEKERLRAARLAAWKALSVEQRNALYEQALHQADSDFTRSRLRRHRDINHPPTEVLAIMAGAGERGVVADDPHRSAH